MKKRLENAQEFGIRAGLYAAKLGESLRTGSMAGMLLCGDAAGYHGIVPAAISGLMAADTTIAAFDTSDFTDTSLKAYDRTRRKHPISKYKFGITFPGVLEEGLNNFLKSEGEAINKELFRDFNKPDYDI